MDWIYTENFNQGRDLAKNGKSKIVEDFKSPASLEFNIYYQSGAVSSNLPGQL